MRLKAQHLDSMVARAMTTTLMIMRFQVCACEYTCAFARTACRMQYCASLLRHESAFEWLNCDSASCRPHAPQSCLLNPPLASLCTPKARVGLFSCSHSRLQLATSVKKISSG